MDSCRLPNQRQGKWRENLRFSHSLFGWKVCFRDLRNREVVAFDLEGHEKWRFNAQERYGKFRYGFGFHSTTVLHEGRLYLQLIHSAAQLVICVEADSGKEVWKVERESDGVAECEHSYASPIAFRKGELNFLITHGNDYCIGHDPLTGKEQWRVAGLNPKNQYNRTLRFVASPSRKSGLVGCPFGQEPGVSVVRLSEAKGRIEKGGAGELWRMDRGTTGVTTPLLYKGLLYLCKENGTILCLDALTGEQFYQERFHAQTYRGSPVAANGRIFLTARDGTFTVLKAGKSYEVIGKNKLDDQFTASPIIAHDRLYLRGHRSLYAIAAPIIFSNQSRPVMRITLILLSRCFPALVQAAERRLPRFRG